MGSLKEELLKPIWHAFTALDLDRSGKVSKSQLKASPGEMGERLEPSTRRGDGAAEAVSGEPSRGSPFAAPGGACPRHFPFFWRTRGAFQARVRAAGRGDLEKGWGSTASIAKPSCPT